MDDHLTAKPIPTTPVDEDDSLPEVGNTPGRPPGRPGTLAAHVITRAEASKLLGIDKSTFRRREQQGHYRSIGDDKNGVKLYDRDAILGVETTDGADPNEASEPSTAHAASTMNPTHAATSKDDVRRVFVELAKDEDLVRIVLETGLPPAAVLELHASWTTLKRRSGGYHISRRSLDRLDRLELDGFPARGEEELVAAIVAIRDGVKNCERCRRAPRKPPQLCGTCEREVEEIKHAEIERGTTMRLRGERGTPARMAKRTAPTAAKRA